MRTLGDWYVYCDLCGQRHYASETTKLSHYTGKGGLIVCRHDTDAIDPGLIPFRPRREQVVPDVRINHTDTTNSSPIVNFDTMTIDLYLASSQDNIILTTSQDTNAWLIVSEPI